jgi:hypothetical protein
MLFREENMIEQSSISTDNLRHEISIAGHLRIEGGRLLSDDERAAIVASLARAGGVAQPSSGTAVADRLLQMADNMGGPHAPELRALAKQLCGLAQAAPKPVAWRWCERPHNIWRVTDIKPFPKAGRLIEPLYASPVSSTSQGSAATKHSGTFLGYRDKHGNEMHCAQAFCPHQDKCRKGCICPVAVPSTHREGK